MEKLYMCEKTNKVRVLCQVKTVNGQERKLIYTDVTSLKTGNIKGYNILNIIEVMECSGIRDKNGHYIYVGDVIKRSLGKGFFDIGSITFEDSEFWMNFYWEPSKQNLKAYLDDLENVKIIGKIYKLKEFDDLR